MPIDAELLIIHRELSPWLERFCIYSGFFSPPVTCICQNDVSLFRFDSNGKCLCKYCMRADYWETALNWNRIGASEIVDAWKTQCIKNCSDKRIIFVNAISECLFLERMKCACARARSRERVCIHVNHWPLLMSVLLIDCNLIKSSVWASNQLSKSILYAWTTHDSTENWPGV